MILADPEMKLVFAKIGNVGVQIGALVVEGLAGQDPSHVRPETTIARGVGIARLVGELVMNPMRGYPENRAAFQRQRGTNRQEIFQPLRALVAAMGQQPVITHANAETAGNPIQEQSDEQSLPTKHE